MPIADRSFIFNGKSFNTVEDVNNNLTEEVLKQKDSTARTLLTAAAQNASLEVIHAILNHKEVL